MDTDRFDQIIAALTGDIALYAYSWAAIVLTLLISLTVARALLNIAKTFNEADVLRRYPGPPPTKSGSIDRRIRDLRQHASRTASAVALRALGLMVVGLVIPGAVIAVLVVQQDWFLPGPAALALNGQGVGAAEIGALDLGVFLSDQALRGGLADSFEVFGLGISPIENNPDNLTFSGIILAYRVLAGAVMLAIGYLIHRVILGRRHVQAAIQRLEEGI
jgi:hypothetical protein